MLSQHPETIHSAWLCNYTTTPSMPAPSHVSRMRSRAVYILSPRFKCTQVLKIAINQNPEHWQHQKLAGCGAAETLIHCWWERNMVQSPWKRVWWLFIKPNILLLPDPAMHPLVFTQRRWNLHPHKNPHTDVYSSFIQNCPSLETTKIPFSYVNG